MKEMLYAVRCLKPNKDMILALAGQFKQLSLNLKNSGDSTGFEPMTSALPVQVRGSYLHLISNNALHIGFLSYDNPFTGKQDPNKLTCSPLCDFIAQLVRALHRHRRGHGFESR